MELPAFRKLRGYAFDPSLSNQLDTYIINEVTYKIPWEEIEYNSGTLCGEYLEIVDYDPTIDKFYEIINLDDKLVLANNGLDPSESNPKFHQQMVYAVTMTTIKNFEKALGRKVLWAPRRLEYDPVNGKKQYEEYVDKLRIYPHALREANAFYSPQKKALLFGYFYSNPEDVTRQMSNTLVFSCLSHDILAHEITHAILDGMQIHYNEPSNPDVLAFHEAFADIVALFQHFSFPEVLKHQIAKTKGDLSSQNLLGELAQQFGVAIGNYGSLRDAIGGYNETTGEWEPAEPNPQDYYNILEPHQRGSILVAAVFEAFLSIYKRRVVDLYRIASNGTGILPKGELHPDLVNRLAEEASKISTQVLNMCIRAIDYCPPVDITFGDYLRAIITADYDLINEDSYGYRLAFVEAFKNRGIYPSGVKSLSIESLQYPKVDISENSSQLIKIIGKFLRDFSHKIAYHTDRKNIYDISNAMISGMLNNHLRSIMGLKQRQRIMGLHRRINVKFNDSDEFIKLTGLALVSNWRDLGVPSSTAYGSLCPSFQVHNLRLVSRTGPKGARINQVVFTILQRVGCVIQNGEYIESFQPQQGSGLSDDSHLDGYIFRSGCTFILDLDTRNLKYVIAKPLLVDSPDGDYELNKEAIIRQCSYKFDAINSHFNEFQRYFGAGTESSILEPLSILHQH